MRMYSVTPTVKAHVVVCKSDTTYCGHPVEAGEIYNFGNGEITCMHLHADCVYTDDTALWHGQTGVHARAKILLTRSLDGGLTWPESGHTVVFDQGQPLEKQREILSCRATGQNTPPLTSSTIFHFGKSFSGDEIGEGMHQVVPFVMRSEDKGRTWSKEFAIPVNNAYTFYQAATLSIRQGNVVMNPFEVSTYPGADNNTDEATMYSVMYRSEDHGVTWEFMSVIARDPLGEDSYSYPCAVDLGNGKLLATTGNWRVPNWRTRWISVCHSYDNGLNWTQPVRIQSFGVSPYTVVLRDGRVLIIYARRTPETLRGIFGIVSNDEGATWSSEFLLRNDASGGDIGYPVATQLDNGDIFTAYYYMVQDGLPRGGARHIAGTIFSI